MSRLFALVLAALPATITTTARAAEPEAPAVTRRVALIVGINDGGPGRVRLRYAGTDAKALARVLGDLGGIDRRDRVVLLEPTPEQLREGFARATARVQEARAAGERVEFVFYYSGHADERGLLLGGSRVDYAKLRAQIHGVPAQVRLGMLDSCSSGAFVRTKGGRMRPPIATGEASVEGHAFLTSSSAEEAAQESDRIGGSFFTHYLISGLRGAADVNRDRRVTLNEAYRFAFDETLAGTETTPGRAQHPAYDIQLVGTGDLVLTDLRETTATLEITPTIGGRVYIRDDRGDLAAELYKGVGAGPVTLALEPGNYQVVVDDGHGLFRASVHVRSFGKTELRHTDLAPISAEPTTARGGPMTPDPGDYRRIPVSLGLVPPLTINHIEKRRRVVNNFGLNLLLGRAHQIRGVEVSSGGNWTVEDMHGVQLSAALNLVGRDAHGFQSTAGVNLVRGRFRGVQGAAGANLVGGPLIGVQAAAGFNMARGLRGVQAAAGFNATTDGGGLQIAPINAAGEFHGAQVGVINVSRGPVRGAQVGVINYAEEADASLGVIAVTKKGGVFVDLWTSDTAVFNAALKFRARHTYTLLTAGIHPNGVMTGLGFGGHFPVRGRFYIDADLLTSAVHPRFQGGPPALLSTLRLLFGFQVGRRFAVFGGPTFNGWVDLGGDRGRIGYPYHVWHRTYASELDVGVRLWPGFALGVQL